MNILPPVYVYIYIDQTLRKISRLTNIASQCPGLTKCHLCIVQSTLPDVASFSLNGNKIVHARITDIHKPIDLTIKDWRSSNDSDLCSQFAPSPQRTEIRVYVSAASLHCRLKELK